MQQAIDLFTGGAEGAGVEPWTRWYRDPTTDLMLVHFYFCDNSRGGAVEFPRSQLSRRAVGAGGLTGDTDSLDGSTHRHGKVSESPWV